MNLIYKTSNEWFKIYQKEKLEQNIDIQIYDYDGWRNNNCIFYTDIITEKDFMQRFTKSTIIWKKILKAQQKDN